MRRSAPLALALLGALHVGAASSGARSAREPRGEPSGHAGHPSGGATRLDAPRDGDMIALPGGTFAMGSDGRSAQPNERPVHRVTVRPFRIDRTEVTTGQARACIARGACFAPPPTVNRACTLANGSDDQPLNCVTWTYADAFCRALGKRLPTEAEWEYAARAGGQGPYPWGAASPTCELAVTLAGPLTAARCSPSGPAAAGTHPKGGSPFGVQDLAGNVAEWVADWYADRYDERSASPRVEPRGPGWGVAHVLRGGGWLSSPSDARTSARDWGSLNEAGPNVGFRCAKD